MSQANLPLYGDPGILRRDPPRYGLLKWIGNKQRFASRIVSYFPERINSYFEPFVGSGAVLATLRPARALASDSFAPLMDIWSGVASEPDRVVRWYADRWERFASGDRNAVYDEILRSYNKSPNAADLLFLCRACYGGVVRFRKADGFMSTPIGIHNPISPSAFRKRVMEWHDRVSTVKFQICDYTESMRLAKRGDLVYCDPPYVFSQRILYGAQNFELEGLFSEINACKRRGVSVALSIDGHKRSGREKLDVEIPDGLFEQEIILEGGPSMLKRFQSRGRSLHEERVADRLLLTF